MEIKWRSRQKGTGKRLICPLLAFALVFGLIVVTPGLDGEAEAVDFNQKCSVTVEPTDPKNEQMTADLKNADVVIDLYQVAKAVPVEGYDTYTFEFLSGYEKLEEIYDKAPENADWRKMAQSAARYALENADPVTGGKGAPVYSPVGDLECGLYLLIARGNGIEDYTTEITQEDGAKDIATVAHSQEYTYTFAPELISLPSKQIENADETVDNTTAGNGAWQYSMNVKLKPLQERRYGPLRIIKTLESYEMGDPATFIFHITAKYNGKEYKDVVSITFTPEDVEGQKSYLLEDKIPVGAEVIVEEVYHGGSDYEQVSISPANGTVTIAPADEANPDNVVSVEFTNRYKDTDHGSGSVTNEFNHTENGWQLRQVYDDGTVVEHGE